MAQSSRSFITAVTSPGPRELPKSPHQLHHTDTRLRQYRHTGLSDQTVLLYNHLAVSQTDPRQAILTDVTDLIQQLIAADEWPAPDLLQAILDQGEAAIAPLIAILDMAGDDDDENVAPEFAAQLLASLKASAAIPAIAQLFHRYEFDILELYADVLGAFGADALDAALDLVTNPQLDWYQHAMASEAAKQAAGDDLTLQARVSAVLREHLAGLIARAETFVDDDYDAVGWLISDLADLADPDARPLIDAAFKADIVEAGIINRNDVERLYRRREPRRPGLGDWLGHYRSTYAAHQAAVKREARRADRPQTRVVTPSKSASKPGRNDPCWCGSGKKYKHCHLAQDRA